MQRKQIYGKQSIPFRKILGIVFTMLTASLLQLSVGFAQAKITVTGTITDETGEPLPGVFVSVKGATSNATIADVDGKYTITVSGNEAVLVFSFMGYVTDEIAVGSRAVINVKMKPDIRVMEEIVVIGYGKQSRETITSSISRVTEEEFKYAPTVNPLAQLQGKVAGLTLQVKDGQPGATPEVFIRGGASTSPEGDAPLIIVDGVVGAMRNISQINPDDIESIQVLKDAASTAIYGARAAYGVIIVTTKTGKLNSRPAVNVKYVAGVEEMGRTYNFTSARDYVYISRLNTMKFNTGNPNQFLSNGTYGMSTGNPRNSKNTLEFVDVYINNYGADYVTDLIENQGWETMIDPVTGRRLLFKETNYQDVTFQQAFKQDLSVNISGGGEKNSYYAGVGYVDQDGIVAGTFVKNLSFILNDTYMLHKQVKADLSVSYQYRTHNVIGNYQNVLNRSVTMPFTYRLTYEDGLPAPGEGVTSFRNRNHEIYYRDQYNDNSLYRTTIQGGLVWDILPGLSLNPHVSYFNTEGLYNRFEAYNEVNKNRNASAQHDKWRDFQTDILLNYGKDFFGKHHADVVLGTSYINTYQYVLSGSGYGAPTDNVKTLNATAEETQRISSTETRDAVLSFFGRINYDYHKRYLFSVSLRADGSSKFSENHKWGYFPGVSGGWNIHNENFWKSIKPYVSTLKLRTSWGQTGNNELSLYDTQGRYNPDYVYMGQVGIQNTTLANKNLKWETTTSFDLGADIGLFDNRVSLLVDYYNKLTVDRLFSMPMINTSGFSSVMSNYGSLRSTGFEVELSAKVLKIRDFEWDASFTFSFNRSIVEELPENGEDKNRIGGNTVYDSASQSYIRVGGFAEGERYGGRWAYQMIGVYATDADAANAPFDEVANGRQKEGGDAIWADLNGDGRINHYDMVFMGYIRPDKIGGMVNTFRYKNLSIRFVMDFAVGHVIDNAFRGRSIASARNNNMTLTDVMGDDIWNEQGDIATIPKYSVRSDADYSIRNHLRTGESLAGSSGYITANSLYYKKGDFLAFREISFSYNLPEQYARKIFMKGCEIFGGIYNLGYITEYDGLMPEIYTGNDNGTYPRARQYNIGVKLIF
ncbi:MAG: TonB-dependent receptor [Prevotellaceae bacterium]|jgi:TonB-linked SusC/RagA family outer membrane protein|nr:TonB-dependent receptor [Prevotellaceae bacterium]